MKEIIYKLFSYNSLKYDVILESELIDLVNSNLDENYLFNLHKYLDSKVSTKLAGYAIKNNKFIESCKNDLKKIKKTFL